MKNYICTLLVLLSCNKGFTQQTPAADQNKSILIIGATAHVGDGSLIENSALGIRTGKIVEITTSDLVKNQYKVDSLKLRVSKPGALRHAQDVGVIIHR